MYQTNEQKRASFWGKNGGADPERICMCESKLMRMNGRRRRGGEEGNNFIYKKNKKKNNYFSSLISRSSD